MMHILNLDESWVLATGQPEVAPVEFLTFPGGEPHLKIGNSNNLPDSILIRHRLNSPSAIMQLLLAADAVKRKWPWIPIHAHIPYIPFGRQDRAMNPGEPFSLKVFADIIKTAGFRYIYTLDPHSEVTAALLDPLVVLEPTYLTSVRCDLKLTPYVVVAPDGGSLKKIWNHIKYLDYDGPIVTATKHRDTTNGRITHTTVDVPESEIRGKTFLILDDICDGGMTFIKLAEVLKGMGAEDVLLAVSHGIFSKGETELAKVIDQIYTTTSIKNDQTKLIIRYNV